MADGFGGDGYERRLWRSFRKMVLDDFTRGWTILQETALKVMVRREDFTGSETQSKVDPMYLV